MSKVFNWRGGIHPKKFKNLTKDEPIKQAKIPTSVTIPLSQHTGEDCIPKVSVGDIVKTGTLLAENKEKFLPSIHASISGKVTDISSKSHPWKVKSEAITIKSDGFDNKEIFTQKGEDVVNSFSKGEILKIIQDAGIVGLGGACFPTHAKLSLPQKIDTLIVNGAECEPYLTCDYRLMVEKAADVIRGLGVIMKLLDVPQAFVGIEDDNPLAIKQMQIACRDYLLATEADNLDIKVVTVKTKYPQGGEKQLIKAILKKEVPSGSLPSDIGIGVYNTSTVLAIFEAVYNGKPLYERIVTVSGEGIEKPSNLLIRIGTPLENLINECGGLKGEIYKVIVGGPMMGIAQYSLDVPVVKGTTGVLFFSRREAVEPRDEVCIKCARCCDVCPAYILPFQIARFARKEKWSSLNEYNIKNCIECGCCDYVCPAGIPLVQLIKLGKANIENE